jgi:hypothetical protein
MNEDRGAPPLGVSRKSCVCIICSFKWAFSARNHWRICKGRAQKKSVVLLVVGPPVPEPCGGNFLRGFRRAPAVPRSLKRVPKTASVVIMPRKLPRSVSVGTVIASRRFVVRERRGVRGRHAEIRVGTPKPFDADAYCPVQLVGNSRSKLAGAARWMLSRRLMTGKQAAANSLSSTR